MKSAWQPVIILVTTYGDILPDNRVVFNISGNYSLHLRPFAPSAAKPITNVLWLKLMNIGLAWQKPSSHVRDNTQKESTVLF
jgi:hypothetical protein